MRDRGERKTVQKGGMKEKERAREKGGDSERDSDNTRAFKPPGLKQKAETKSLCASSGPSSLTHILKELLIPCNLLPSHCQLCKVMVKT